MKFLLCIRGFANKAVLARRSHAASERGFTIVELLVSSLIGLIILSMALASTLSSRSLYREDVVRTRINQNLRSAVDIISLNARQAGQSLEEQFPAILLEDGAEDVLILRRNLYEREVLNLCQSLTQATFTPTITVSNDPANTNSNCRYSAGWATYLNTWSIYRQDNADVVSAFAFNRTSRVGEFFLFSGETDDGNQLLIHRQSGNWQNDYVGDGVSSALYLLEEFRYQVTNGVLQLVINDDQTNALNVVDGITQFQVIAHMRDGTTQTALIGTDEWAEVASLELQLTGSEQIAGRVLSSSLNTRIFPRNILSH